MEWSFHYLVNGRSVTLTNSSSNLGLFAVFAPRCEELWGTEFSSESILITPVNASSVHLKIRYDTDTFVNSSLPCQSVLSQFCHVQNNSLFTI